jgi:CubicO group peptidase (beta-lactamase class C family)
MKLFAALFTILLFLGQLACKRREPEQLAGKPEEIAFSGDYQPPVFMQKDRMEHIGKLLSGAHHHYEGLLESYHLPGIAYGLVVDDSLIFQGGSGKANLENGNAVTAHTLFRIASMTKSFTAMAILMLRDEGCLSLSDPVSRYLPELEQLTYLSRDASPVSIYNLLTMTGGFPEDNPWGDRFLDMSDASLSEQVRKGISFSNVPSLNYEYSNLGYGLLGQIISRISGMPYQDYISQYILHPLGMKHTYWEYEEVPAALLARGYRWEDGQWKPEELLHDGAFGAMGGLITSIYDFSKYISLHLSAWPARSDPDSGPLKRSSLREMHLMNHPRYHLDGDRFGNTENPIIRGYGFGLVIMLDHEGVMEVGHNGGLPGFGSSYMFYPQQGIGIMAFSNLTYVGGRVRSANYQVMKELIGEGLFLARTLPVSHILKQRKAQVLELIQTWDPELEEEIAAANLYLDISREQRIRECSELLELTGKIKNVGPLYPENQLRGSFTIEGENRNLKISFTLSPEADPRVQWLKLELSP